MEQNMHVSTDIRILKCFDGLHYSFELLHFNYQGLYEACVSINQNQSNLIPVLSRCWSIVDLVHRIREISQAVPGLNKKNENLVKFLHETNIAESCRHYIQHLREELSKTTPNPFPVWGSLSWVDPQDNSKSFLAVIGAQIPGTSYTGCVYDIKRRKWVSKVTLAIGNLSFNFDHIYEETITFKEFILPWLINTYQPSVKLKNGIPIYTLIVSDKEKLDE